MLQWHAKEPFLLDSHEQWVSLPGEKYFFFSFKFEKPQNQKIFFNYNTKTVKHFIEFVNENIFVLMESTSRKMFTHIIFWYRETLDTQNNLLSFH